MNFGKYALLALAGVSLLAFTSCNKDEKKAAPVIKVLSGTAELNGDATADKFPLIVAAKPADGVKMKELSFVVKYKQGDNESKSDKKVISAKDETLGFTGKIAKEDLPQGVAEGTIIITAVDKEKSESTKEVKFNFGSAPQPKSEWGAEKKGAINHSNGAANGGFDLKNGNTVSLQKGDAANRYMMNVSTDGGAFQKAWSSAKVSSLNATGNGTKFAKVSVDYATVTPDAAKTAFDAASPSTEVTGVNENDVYVAVKDTEVYIIKVTKIDTENNSSMRAGKGCIEFSYKAKK